MNKLIKILSVVILCILFTSVINAQDTEQFKNIEKKEQAVTARTAFANIEESISSSNIESLSGFFSSQMYLSLSNGISGYYSSNQAYYVVEDFFKVYHVVSFKFNEIQDNESNIFATGSYNYMYKGKIEVAQVYVSIKNVDQKWKITQLTIN